MTFFVDDFDVNAKRAALIWSKDDYDSGDVWGWSMSWLFDLAAAIDMRGDDVPPELQYEAGPFGSSVDDEIRAQGLAELSTESLIYAARVLNRYADYVARYGLSY